MRLGLLLMYMGLVVLALGTQLALIGIMALGNPFFILIPFLGLVVMLVGFWRDLEENCGIVEIRKK